MSIAPKDVAEKLTAYLHHELTLARLVAWAEDAMMEGDFGERPEDTRDTVARLGVADVRAFGLTCEDCEDLRRRLGYRVRVDVTSA